MQPLEQGARTEGSSLGFLGVQTSKPSLWVRSSLPREGSAPTSPSKAFVPSQLQMAAEKMGEGTPGCWELDEKSPYLSVS